PARNPHFAGRQAEAPRQREQQRRTPAGRRTDHRDDVARLGRHVDVAEEPPPAQANPRTARTQHRHRKLQKFKLTGQFKNIPGSMGIPTTRWCTSRPDGKIGCMSTRWGMTVPLAGIPLADHAAVYAALADAGFTDLWT